ncbi:MAG TPA: DUF302 domain-containing protein [Chitinophagaceae bacterium]|jgi:uncharacterized protein (DUF302 family)
MDKGIGITSMQSSYAVKETIDRLENLLRSKGLTVFARIDQQAAAQQAGLKMPALELLLFGNPKSGTPLMIAAPLSGIDLPLKAMAWEDAAGNTWLSYNNLSYLQERFSLAVELMKPLAAVETLLKAALV